MTPLIFNRNVSEAVRAPSLAVTVISNSPVKFSGGKPYNRPATKLSQAGRLSPLASFALSAKAALSTSPKLFSGINRSTTVSSFTIASTNGTTTVGASFTGKISMVNCLITSTCPSLALISSMTLPLKFTGGVPVNVRVLRS